VTSRLGTGKSQTFFTVYLFGAVWNKLKTNHVSDQRLSLGENSRNPKLAFSPCFQDENNLYKNPGTEIINQHPRTETSNNHRQQHPTIKRQHMTTNNKHLPSTDTSNKSKATPYSLQRAASKNIKVK
jgi:hypothetical protein